MNIGGIRRTKRSSGRWQVFTGLTMQRAGALSGRDFDNLKRAKVLGVNPGKGQRNAYGPKEIKKLLVALELEEFGVTPATITKLLTKRWESFGEIVSRAARRAAARIRTLCSGFFRSFCPDAGVARANCRRSARSQAGRLWSDSMTGYAVKSWKASPARLEGRACSI